MAWSTHNQIYALWIRHTVTTQWQIKTKKNSKKLPSSGKEQRNDRKKGCQLTGLQFQSNTNAIAFRMTTDCAWWTSAMNYVQLKMIRIGNFLCWLKPSKCTWYSVFTNKEWDQIEYQVAQTKKRDKSIPKIWGCNSRKELLQLHLIMCQTAQNKLHAIDLAVNKNVYKKHTQQVKKSVPFY